MVCSAEIGKVVRIGRKVIWHGLVVDLAYDTTNERFGN